MEIDPVARQKCNTGPAELLYLAIKDAGLRWRRGIERTTAWAVDRTLEGGVSLSGKQWVRPEDTISIAGVVNGISSAREAFLDAGGLCVLIGDGQLPYPGLEQIIETYYGFAVSRSTHLTFDYQFVANPAYDTDRGPVNIFAGRFHWQS